MAQNNPPSNDSPNNKGERAQVTQTSNESSESDSMKLVDRLDLAETQRQDILNWVRQRVESQNQTFQIKAEDAFKGFTASVVSKSIQEKPNYLKDRNKLKESLVAVRGKTLKRMEEKTVKFFIDDEIKTNLDWKENKVEISITKLEELLSPSRQSEEIVLERAIQKKEQHIEKVNIIAERLLQYISRLR